MTMDELKVNIGIILKSLRVTCKEISLVKDISFQFVIEDFGMIISGINRADYSIVKEAVDFHFKDWRSVYFTTFDDVIEMKESIVWELMRAGYMRWIRFNFPRQFNNLIVMEGFGRKIIDQRLKIYGGRPKYKFLIEDNEDAKNSADSYVLSIDPGFYDTMPE
jgi:hypothetical protein